MKEDIIFTAEPEQMQGKYVAEDLSGSGKRSRKRPIRRTVTSSTPRSRRKKSFSRRERFSILTASKVCSSTYRPETLPVFIALLSSAGPPLAPLPPGRSRGRSSWRTP